MNSITVYTDGSCSPNPGPGGWGAIIILSDVEFHLSGGKKQTTNNKMELLAVIKALEFLVEEKLPTKKTKIRLHSDSAWVINCAQGLWKRRKNLHLWARFDNIAKNCSLKWIKVKAHSGLEYNELVDKLAKNEMCQITEEIKKKKNLGKDKK